VMLHGTSTVKFTVELPEALAGVKVVTVPTGNVEAVIVRFAVPPGAIVTP